MRAGADDLERAVTIFMQPWVIRPSGKNLNSLRRDPACDTYMHDRDHSHATDGLDVRGDDFGKRSAMRYVCPR